MAIRDVEVSQADVERVIDAAKAVAIPADQKILHIFPKNFLSIIRVLFVNQSVWRVCVWKHAFIS